MKIDSICLTKIHSKYLPIINYVYSAMNITIFDADQRFWHSRHKQNSSQPTAEMTPRPIWNSQNRRKYLSSSIIWEFKLDRIDFCRKIFKFARALDMFSIFGEFLYTALDGMCSLVRPHSDFSSVSEPMMKIAFISEQRRLTITMIIMSFHVVNQSPLVSLCNFFFVCVTHNLGILNALIWLVYKLRADDDHLTMM